MAASRPKPWDLFLVFDVHYDSWFEFSPLMYDNGLVYSWATRKDNLLGLKDVLKLLKERTGSHILYEMFFRLPQCELDVGLKQVNSDQDLEAMYEYARRYGLIHVYLTHGPQEELAQYVEENGYYGTDDEIISRKKGFFKHAGNMSEEDLISWAEEEAGMTSVGDKGKGISGRGKGTVDKGKGIFVDDSNGGRKSSRTRNIGVVIGENPNPTIGDPDPSDSDDMEQRFSLSADLPEMYDYMSESESEKSDKSVDYLSEGEDELISLRKRNIEARQNRNKDNNTQTPQAAGPSKPVREFETGETDIVLEHEEYMDTLMQQLRDRRDVLADPFTLGENEQTVDSYPIHDEQTHWKMRKPKVGEKYKDIDQLKKCLTYYSLANGFSLWYYRSQKEKLIARCGMRPVNLKDPTVGKQRKHNKYPTDNTNEGSKCPFRCYGKKMKSESSFQVISLIEDHTCVRNFKFGNLVNYKWIATHFGQKIRQNPEIKLHEIADLVLKKYKCIVSPNQCRYAKRKALIEGELTIEEHYAMIRSYGKEILDTNDGSTVKLGVTVNPDNKTYFDRFYCCFHGLKMGFQLGCRPVIALDGCFMKKPNVGEILTAIGRDGNNHIYPIAWAVVNVENKDNWSWFLQLLGEDIGMPNGNGLTLMSDQHKVYLKGLIEAVKEVMPLAEHRQCARHIYEGFRKQFSGVEFRELFWAASKASYPQLFSKIMQKIKRANPNAYDYLVNKDPKTWSRAFFRLGSNCEAVENGFSECFNSVLLMVRSKPLITMLESMRVLVMERLNTMRKMHEKWTRDICPNIQKRLELNKDKHRFWHVIPAGGDLYEVRNGSDAFRVDEKNRTCTCRMWQLSGLPCPHSIAVIFLINKAPEDYIPPCFRRENYVNAYNQFMTPVGGMTFWPDSSMYSTVLAPKPRRMPGRPRKQRMRASHERKYTHKISRAGLEITCHNFYQKGHNKATCSNPTVTPPTKQPTTRGRPLKKTNTPITVEEHFVDQVHVTNVEGPDAVVGANQPTELNENNHIQPNDPTNIESNNTNIIQPNDTINMDFVTIRAEPPPIDEPRPLESVMGRGRGSAMGRGRGSVMGKGRGSVMGRGRTRGRGRAGGVALGIRRVTSDGVLAARTSQITHFSEISKTATTSIGRGKGRGRPSRGRGGRTNVDKYGKLAKWFGIGAQADNDGAGPSTPVTQQSQVGSPTNLRPRSARIMERRMSTSMEATGSSCGNTKETQ